MFTQSVPKELTHKICTKPKDINQGKIPVKYLLFGVFTKIF